MNLKNINSTLIVLLIAFTSTFAQNVSLEIQNVDLEVGTLDVHMVNDVAVGGYQFELFGITIESATAPSGFFGNNSGNSMLGFSLSGATIPAGSSVLSTVTFSNYLGDTICFGTENSCAGASPNVA